MGIVNFVYLNNKAGIINLINQAAENFQWDSPKIAAYVKMNLDQHFGCSWHVVVGEQFSFNIDFEVILKKIFKTRK